MYKESNPTEQFSYPDMDEGFNFDTPDCRDNEFFQKTSTLYFYPNVDLEGDEYSEIINFIKSEGSELSESTFNKLQFLSNFESLQESFELRRWHIIWEALVGDELGKKFVNVVLSHFNHQSTINKIPTRDKSTLLQNVSDYDAYSYVVSNLLTTEQLSLLTMNPNLSDKTLSIIYPKVKGMGVAANRIKRHPNIGELTRNVIQQNSKVLLSPLEFSSQRQLNLLKQQSTPEIIDILQNSSYAEIRSEIAKSRNTPISILEKLSDDNDKGVRYNVSMNNNTPIYILEKLSNDNNVSIRESIARNLNTPISILEKLSDDNDKGVRCNVSMNNNTPIHILEKLSNDTSLNVRWGVLQNYNVPISVLEKLSNDNSVSIRESIARNLNTPISILEKLSDDNDKGVRYNVSMNNNTPIHILEKLSNDTSLSVRWGVLQNYNAPISVLEKLSNDDNVNVREMIARNPNTPIPILEKLSNDTSLTVRESIARNLNTPISILEKLSDDTSLSVRRGVLQNYNTPISILKKLSTDIDERLRNESLKLLKFLDSSSSSTLTKDQMKDKGFRGKESFDHRAIVTDTKDYMYGLGVNGKDWTRLIYSSDNVIPAELFQAFNLHNKPFRPGSGYDKVLGWIGGKFDPDNKILYVTEMQSDLLQRTFELRKPIFVKKGWDKYKSKIENMFNGWQEVFFNQAMREARDRGAEFVYVPTSSFYKTKHPGAPVQYYDKIVEDYPHEIQGNWNIIKMQDNLKIASMGNGFFQLDDETIPIEKNQLEMILKQSFNKTEDEVDDIIQATENDSFVVVPKVSNKGTVVDIYEVDYPDPINPQKETQNLAYHLDEERDFITQYLFPGVGSENIDVIQRQDNRKSRKNSSINGIGSISQSSWRVKLIHE